MVIQLIMDHVWRCVATGVTVFDHGQAAAVADPGVRMHCVTAAHAGLIQL